MRSLQPENILVTQTGFKVLTWYQETELSDSLTV